MEINKTKEELKPDDSEDLAVYTLLNLSSFVQTLSLLSC